MNPGVLQKLDHAAQETAEQWQNENRAMLSPEYPDTRRPHNHRSASNTSVPDIEVETPVSKFYFSHVIIVFAEIVVLVLSHSVNSFRKNYRRPSPTYTRKCQ